MPNGQSDHQACTPPTLSPWKQKDGRNTEDLITSFSLKWCCFSLSFENWTSLLSRLPLKGSSEVTVSYLSRSRRVIVLPALAVREAQVHAVAGEEGAGVQRELHTGRVRDGLTQHSHHSGTRRRPGVAAKWTHVTCTVEDLEKQKPDWGSEEHLKKVASTFGYYFSTNNKMGFF